MSDSLSEGLRPVRGWASKGAWASDYGGSVLAWLEKDAGLGVPVLVVPLTEEAVNEYRRAFDRVLITQPAKRSQLATMFLEALGITVPEEAE